MHLLRRSLVALTFCFALGRSTQGQEYVYYADLEDNAVRRVDLSSGVTEDVRTNLAAPIGVALDPCEEQVYWTEFSSGTISRADLDGQNPEVLVSAGLNGPGGIALDSVGGKMYWTDPGSGAGRLLRADLDGQDVEVLIPNGLIDPIGIDLDRAAGKIYWAEYDGRRIRRCNLDGSGVETLVSGIGSPSGLALDLIQGKIYWADAGEFGPGALQRSNLDGTGLETLLGTIDGSTVAVDPKGDRIVFSDSSTNLLTADLNGVGSSFLAAVAGDTGMAALWLPSPGTSYCTAKPSSSGCLATIRGCGSGPPASGQADYRIVVSGAEALRPGIFFGSNTAPTNIPFQGGTLCIQPPLRRSAVLFTFGTASNCDGGFDLLINDGNQYPSGFDAGPGGTSYMQTWYRDPALMDGFDSALSNAVQLDWQ